MNIRITVENDTLSATLDNTRSAHDFAALLPLTLELDDYGGIEKVSELPRRLSTEGAPAGVTPAVGDLAYYAPWGNLAIFIEDFSYSRGLVRLGQVQGDVAPLRRKGRLTVRIEHETR
ncbi:MAG: hypothetical protein IAE66_04735 [Xanthomonadaceae bacterium]|nr:hypothetical protein [Xanthomonadaceae bacterium]